MTKAKPPASLIDIQRLLESLPGKRDGALDAHAAEAIAYCDKTRQEIKRLPDALSQQVEEITDEYISNVIHDLQTPLSVIVIRTEMLMRKSLPAERAQKILAIIEANYRRVKTMIDEMAKPACRQYSCAHARLPLSLRDLAKEVIAQNIPPESQRRVRLQMAGADPLMVAGDKENLKRALINLITNALKFSKADTRVKIKIIRVGGNAEISVADEGAGIDPEDLPRIFDRLYRGKKSGEKEGLGLGLYICRLIVEAHGGRIWAESKLGEGSTFYVSLPLI